MEGRAFQIEDKLNIGIIFDPYCVLHQHNIDWLQMRHLDCVHSVDTRKDRSPIPDKMSIIIRKGIQESIHLVVSQRLDDELFIVREEEKAPGLPRILPSFENHFFVVLAV